MVVNVMPATPVMPVVSVRAYKWGQAPLKREKRGPALEVPANNVQILKYVWKK